MIELINNAIEWCLTNANKIHMIASLIGALISLAVVIIVFIHKKLVKQLNASVDKLTLMVEDYKQLMGKLESMETTIKNYDATAKESVEEMFNVEEVDLQMLKKLNSVLDVLGLAYSTITNDDIRLGITNIINYAKYLDPSNDLLKKRELSRAETKQVKEAITKLAQAAESKANEVQSNETEVKTVKEKSTDVRRW